jgi:hypothetical protein
VRDRSRFQLRGAAPSAATLIEMNDPTGVAIDFNQNSPSHRMQDFVITC